MIKRLVHWLLGYSVYILLLGLGLFGMAAYTSYKASVGGKIPPETDLVVQSGKVLEGREMTVESRRRRSGRKTTKKYYELDLKPANGEVLKLRVDFAVPRSVLEQVLDEDVTVKYDRSDNNTAYVIRFEDQDLVSYAEMAAISQSEADARKELFASSGAMGAAAAMVLAGAGGIVLRRKMQAADDETLGEEKEEGRTPAPEVKIGSNLADVAPMFDKEAAFKPVPSSSSPPLPSELSNRQRPHA